MHLLSRRLTVAFACATALWSCSDEPPSTPPAALRVAPRPVVPTNLSAIEGATVTLDGSGSYDPDGTIATYAWRQSAGATVTLAGGNAASASFTAPAVSGTATLRFVLALTDNDGEQSESVEVIVTVIDANQSPVADPGADRIVTAGDTVNLDGSASIDRDDGAVSSYAWSQVDGESVVLSGADTPAATFIAPDVVQPSFLIFALTVTDSEGKIATATVTVLVEPVPVALSFSGVATQIESDMPFTVRVAVRNASNKTIVSGAASQLVIALIRQTGSGALSGTLVRQASGGVAVFSGLVYDQPESDIMLRASVVAPVLETLSVAIDVVETNPQAVVDAGVGQTVDARSSVILTGTASDDGSISETLWEQVSGPAVSVFDADTLSANFTAPDVVAPLTLSFQLTVIDNLGKPNTATTSVTINPVATRLVIGGTPSAVLRNRPWPNLSVQIRNQSGLVITGGAPASAAVALQVDTGAGQLQGTTSVAAVNGVATFSGLYYDLEENDVIIAAAITVPALVANTPPVDVTWGSLLPGTLSSTDGTTDVISLASLDGAGLCVGGSFDTATAMQHFALDGSDTGTQATAADAFIARYGADGTLAWARTFDSGADDRVSSLATLGGELVALLTVGDITPFDAAPFDPTTGTLTGGSASSDDIALARFSASGALVWVRTIGSAGTERAIAVTPTSDGDLVVAGFSDDNALDVDPCGSTEVVNLSGGGFFVARLETDELGGACTGDAVTWVAPLTFSNGDVSALAIDASGNVYLTGNLGETYDFDPGPGTETHNPNPAASVVFVLRLNSDGSFAWVKTFGGGSGGDASYGAGLAIDGGGNLWVTGALDGNNANPGFTDATRWSSSGGTDIFVASYTLAGVFRPSASFVLGGTSNDYPSTLSARGDLIVVGGGAASTIDFDPSSGQASRSPVGTTAFSAGYDGAGAFRFAEVWSSGNAETRAVLLSGVGGGPSNVWVGSTAAAGAIDLDPRAPTIPWTITAPVEAVLHKLDASGLVTP